MNESAPRARITPERFWLVFFSLAAMVTTLFVAWWMLRTLPFHVGPRGGFLIRAVPGFLAWIAISAALAFSWLLWVILEPRNRARPKLHGVAFAGWLALAPACVLAGVWTHSWQWERAIRNTEALSTAVEAYVSERGEAPSTLDELVPRYLPSMPSGPPTVSIRRGEDLPSSLQHGQRWTLVANEGGADLWFYFPDARYPDRILGKRLERVGDWAYRHE